jgi:hypothetical protein
MNSILVTEMETPNQVGFIHNLSTRLAIQLPIKIIHTEAGTAVAIGKRITGKLSSKPRIKNSPREMSRSIPERVFMIL